MSTRQIHLAYRCNAAQHTEPIRGMIMSQKGTQVGLLERTSMTNPPRYCCQTVWLGPGWEAAAVSRASTASWAAPSMVSLDPVRRVSNVFCTPHHTINLHAIAYLTSQVWSHIWSHDGVRYGVRYGPWHNTCTYCTLLHSSDTQTRTNPKTLCGVQAI